MVELDAELIQLLYINGTLNSESSPYVGGSGRGVKDDHVQAVLSNISGASILYLVCHGSAQDIFPESSSFLLRDGELTLSQLLQLELPLTQFPFLSAFNSATGDESRLDGRMYMAAAMLTVGFKSVTGTMWR